MLQLLIAIIYVTFISLGLPDSLLGSAWPSMYLGLDVPISYAGIISMMIAGSTIISSLLSDRLVRKIGTGWIIVISVGTTATALFGFSVSSSFVMLCLWAVPYGLGAGSVDAVLNNFVALHYKAKHMSWLHCFWGIGATLGPYIMGISLTGNFGWHYGYRFISMIQIALTGILLCTLPLWKKNINQSGEKHSSTTPIKYKQLFKLPGAKKILIAFFCYCSLEQVAGLWGSSYMVLKKGITPEAAASYISLFYLGITGGRFLSGVLTLKLNTKGLIRLGQGLVTFGIALLFVSTTQTVMYAGLILVGLGCAPIYPSLLHQTPDRFGKNASQSMMGLQMACAYIGSTFSPLLMGLLADQIGIAFYPLILLIFTGVMILLVENSNRKLGTDRREVNE